MYEPPASRYARRVPLLLRKKGRGPETAVSMHVKSGRLLLREEGEGYRNIPEEGTCMWCAVGILAASRRFNRNESKRSDFRRGFF